MPDPHPLFDEISGKYPAVDRDDPTGPIPVVPAPGVDDDLVEHTDNGLRAEDLELEQPSQDPSWRPDADR